LEDGGDHDGAHLLRDPAERVGGRARHWLGQVEARVVLALAEVLRAEELREADHLRALAGGLAYAVDRRIEVRGGIRRAAHLDQTDAEPAGCGHGARVPVRVPAVNARGQSRSATIACRTAIGVLTGAESVARLVAPARHRSA